MKTPTCPEGELHSQTAMKINNCLIRGAPGRQTVHWNKLVTFAEKGNYSIWNIMLTNPSNEMQIHTFRSLCKNQP